METSHLLFTISTYTSYKPQLHSTTVSHRKTNKRHERSLEKEFICILQEYQTHLGHFADSQKFRRQVVWRSLQKRIQDCKAETAFQRLVTVSSQYCPLFAGNPSSLTKTRAVGPVPNILQIGWKPKLFPWNEDLSSHLCVNQRLVSYCYI